MSYGGAVNGVVGPCVLPTAEMSSCDSTVPGRITQHPADRVGLVVEGRGRDGEKLVRRRWANGRLGHRRRSGAVGRGIGTCEFLSTNLAPCNRPGTERHDHITTSVGAGRTVLVGSRRRERLEA